MRTEDQDQNVRAAWDGKGNRRSVEKRDGEDPGKAEMKHPGRNQVVMWLWFNREVHAWYDAVRTLQVASRE
jgi:hypothetical protein